MKHSPAVERALARFHRHLADLRAFKVSGPEKQRLARMVREEHGVEVTPDEAERELASALDTVRHNLIDAGHREFQTMSLNDFREFVREAIR